MLRYEASSIYWIDVTLFLQNLRDKIELVPIDHKNRPAWYKEKVYPANKVKAFLFSCASMIWFDCQVL